MDALNEVENGNRKMLCYPVMSVELHMLLENQNTGIRLPAQFLRFSNQAHLQVQTFFMYFINHKTLLIWQGLSGASVWGISQCPVQCNNWNLTFLLQVLSELSAPADVSEQTTQKLRVSHSHYWKQHCQVQQLCHRPQIIHSWTPRVRPGLFTSWGKISQQTAPFCVIKVPCENVTSQHPPPSSCLLLHLWTLWRAQTPALGPLFMGLKPCQAIMLWALSIIQLPQLQTQRKTSKIGLEITAPRLQTCLLPCLWTFPSSHPTSNRLCFDEHTATNLLPPAPDNSHFKNH